MQVQKQEVKDRIYEVALVEFRENGYLNSSMRSIAKAAGMTVGNLYRYFKNKDDLFYAVINPVYKRVTKLITDHGHPHPNTETDKFILFLTDSIISIFSEYRYELLILIDGTKGTIYEDVKFKITEMIKNHKRNFVDSPSNSGNFYNLPDNYINFTMELISSTFIEGLIKILKSYTKEEDLRYLITILTKFCFNDLQKRFS